MVFLDKLCIEQRDPIRKAKGIRGLAAFLDRSESMVIMWSSQYLTRPLDESEKETRVSRVGVGFSFFCTSTNMFVQVALSSQFRGTPRCVDTYSTDYSI